MNWLQIAAIMAVIIVTSLAVGIGCDPKARNDLVKWLRGRAWRRVQAVRKHRSQ